ncbi:MAG TPA: phage tail protein [Burkholderiaceae bacterium]
MTTYSAVLTNAGAALYAAALAANTPIQLATMAVGDGGGSPVATPDKTRTSLVNQVYGTSISNLTVDPGNANLMWAEMVLPPTVGGFTVREAGIFTASGTLFAICNFPDTIKTVTTSGAPCDLVINFGMVVSNTALVTFTIDPNVVTATHAWVLSTVTPAYLFPGGTQYQALRKNSSTPGDMGWQDPGSPWEFSLTTTGGVTAITSLQAYNALIKVSGALTAPATIAFPAAFGKWVVINMTTGNFPLTAAVAGGSGVPILQGHADTVHSDGVNMAYSTASAVTRPLGDNSLALANTAYVDRAVSAMGQYEIDTGVANAYVVATTPATTAYLNGATVRFRVAHANTAASTLDAGAGPVPLLRGDGGALQKGDLPFDIVVCATYDQPTASFLLESMVYSQFGTAARLNASDQNGGVSTVTAYVGNPNGFVSGNAAVIGVSAPSMAWDPSADNLWVCTTSGTAATAVWSLLQGGGSLRAINANGALGPGIYLIDTRANTVAITLPSRPNYGDTFDFIDAAGTFGANNLILNNNGNTIMGILDVLYCNVSGLEFRLWWNGADWRLQ